MVVLYRDHSDTHTVITHSHTHTHTHTHTLTHRQTDRHTYIHTHTHSHTDRHTYTLTDQTDRHTPTHTLTHLRSSLYRLEDILVLHLEGGKDFFISVSGNYIQSSFGQSLEKLVQLHVPIREVPTERLIDVSSSFALVSGRGLAVVYMKTNQ